MIFICNELGFFTDDFKQGLSKYIKHFETPNNPYRLFFEKYCLIPEMLEKKEIIDLAYDIESMTYEEYVKKEKFIIKIPTYIVAFLSFIDDNQYNQLSNEQQILFDIISNHDFQKKSNILEVDLAIEGSNVEMIIVNYFLKYDRLTKEGDKLEKELPNLLNLVASIGLERKNIIIQNMIDPNEKKIQETANNLISSLKTFGSKFDDETVELSNPKEQELFEKLKKKVDLIQKNVDDPVLKENQLTNPIYNLYKILCTNIGVKLMDAVGLLFNVDKEAGLILLFSVFVGIDNVRDWWVIYEAANRNLKKFLLFLKSQPQDEQNKEAETSGIV